MHNCFHNDMLVFIIIAVVRLHSHSGMLYSVALHACNHACLDHERSKWHGPRSVWFWIEAYEVSNRLHPLDAAQNHQLNNYLAI